MNASFDSDPAAPKASSYGETSAWLGPLKMMLHYARQSQSATKGGSSGNRPSRPHRQRCAVRITYSKNTVRGQWRAHGRYLERESAAAAEPTLSAEGKSPGLATELQKWQTAQDQLMWKIIISPEFGERADLQKLTTDLMGRMEEDLGHSLEWISVVHRNTDHPHVHVALRGRASRGETLRLDRSYVKHGVREIAEELCTRQLGFRTSLDVAEAQRREVKELCFTPLDRSMLRSAILTDKGHLVKPDKDVENVKARLKHLEKLDLASSSPDGSWFVKPEAEEVLKAMQRTKDRQKTLAAHGDPASDARLPIEVLNWRDMPTVEGRVLVHGQDEQSGKSYLMLESTAAKIFYIPYTREMEETRSRGGLKTNSFVRLQKMFRDSSPATQVEELGTAESILSNRTHLREKVRHLRLSGAEPVGDGWLGKYQKALRAEFEIQEANKAKPSERSRRAVER